MNIDLLSLCSFPYQLEVGTSLRSIVHLVEHLSNIMLYPPLIILGRLILRHHFHLELLVQAQLAQLLELSFGVVLYDLSWVPYINWGGLLPAT